MNEKLQKALENILKNEQEADKFAKFETVDEMYSYFKKEIPDLDEEEFNDFIDEILEWYESNEESIKKLQEDSLNNISGGANSIARFGAGIFAMLALLPGMQNANAAQVKSAPNHAVAKLQKIANSKSASANNNQNMSRYFSKKKTGSSKQSKKGTRLKKLIIKVGALALLAYGAHKAGLTKFLLNNPDKEKLQDEATETQTTELSPSTPPTSAKKVNSQDKATKTQQTDVIEYYTTKPSMKVTPKTGSEAEGDISHWIKSLAKAGRISASGIPTPPNWLSNYFASDITTFDPNNPYGLLNPNPKNEIERKENKEQLDAMFIKAICQKHRRNKRSIEDYEQNLLRVIDAIRTCREKKLITITEEQTHAINAIIENLVKGGFFSHVKAETIYL